MAKGFLIEMINLLDNLGKECQPEDTLKTNLRSPDLYENALILWIIIANIIKRENTNSSKTVKPRTMMKKDYI